MTKQNKPSGSNFWFGFSFGALTMASGAYLLGTKKGREHLKKIMEFAEHHSDESGDIMEFLNALKDSQKPEVSEIKSNLESVINKVKNITLEK